MDRRKEGVDGGEGQGEGQELLERWTEGKIERVDGGEGQGEGRGSCLRDWLKDRRRKERKDR